MSAKIRRNARLVQMTTKKEYLLKLSLERKYNGRLNMESKILTTSLIWLIARRLMYDLYGLTLMLEMF